MKNKGMVYVLVAVVVMVWGMIIYRVCSSVNQDGDAVSAAKVQPLKEAYNDYTVKKDTAALLLNYRDPFAPAVQQDTVGKAGIKSMISAVKPLAKPMLNWGFIKYAGYVRNPGSKKLIALVSINGKNAMMAEGETVQDVKLLKNMNDSIKISFKDQVKCIMMNTAAQ